MREASTAAALGLQKLHLVLDLDHTLLHAVRLSNLTPEEVERLKPEAARNAEGGPASGGGGDLFFVGSETGEGFITKLRPFVREFLREAHEMFQLMVYTMGGRVYSSGTTKLLDPGGEYFSDRVITREDYARSEAARASTWSWPKRPTYRSWTTPRPYGWTTRTT
ncbi:hypothetical protein NL676_002674 [Syzygium grande]|nr:hypothetical protein NL676_002674 [Syzygium grande]